MDAPGVFTVVAETRGGAHVEVRCEPGGIVTAPRYLSGWIIARVEREDVVAATPAGPSFTPSMDHATTAVFYTVVDVLLEFCDPDTLTVYGDVPADLSGQ